MNTEDPTAGHVEQGADAGGEEGVATFVDDLFTAAHSRGGRPGARAVLDTGDAKVVTFDFAAGDVLPEHAARHPVIIQVLRGSVEFTVQNRALVLEPGRLVHLTPMLRHAVRATEPATLTVTMLLPPRA
ncbi:cupin domain-containing protein [Mobilicoccus massiliensis]|uniref:cupin domain-containing protein n=1 Tax=Mobilicoccus massiliensis TaxID=1522310 RepID=UPI00058BCC4A|nr:cupin domain-containing protein [Mobilicoccus massiliensis]